MLFRIFTLLTVIALGISTYILSDPARNRDAAAAAKQADRPGYYLRNSVLTDYDAAGSPTLRIAAERIDQVAHTTEVALRNVQVDYQSPGGMAWTMSGDEAHVQPGGQVVDVAGHVRLNGTDPRQAGEAVVHTDALSYDVAAAVVSTEGDVRIDFGVHLLTARGMVANLKDRTIRLENKVNGRFVP